MQSIPNLIEFFFFFCYTDMQHGTMCTSVVFGNEALKFHVPLSRLQTRSYNMYRVHLRVVYINGNMKNIEKSSAI